MGSDCHWSISAGAQDAQEDIAISGQFAQQGDNGCSRVEIADWPAPH
jgi:hypothetical protein